MSCSVGPSDVVMSSELHCIAERVRERDRETERQRERERRTHVSIKRIVARNLKMKALMGGGWAVEKHHHPSACSHSLLSLSLSSL